MPGCTERQTLPAARVNVIRRDIDSATEAMLAAYDPGALAMHVHIVTVPGVVAALNIGLAQAVGEAVAMTDDDAAPHPDWLERIAGHFSADARVAGVGGRDRIFRAIARTTGRRRCASASAAGMAAPGATTIAASVRPGEVEDLKGVCMAFPPLGDRRAAVRPPFARQGAQVANESLFGGAIRCAGWKLIYDPAVPSITTRRSGPDFSDHRNQIDRGALRDLIHNSTLGYLECMPPARARRCFCISCLGQR